MSNAIANSLSNSIIAEDPPKYKGMTAEELHMVSDMIDYMNSKK